MGRRCAREAEQRVGGSAGRGEGALGKSFPHLCFAQSCYCGGLIAPLVPLNTSAKCITAYARTAYFYLAVQSFHKHADTQTELLKLTRINFSESYQLLAHLKTVRLFVESVLRYGLPADYAGVVIKPDPKTASRTLKGLQHHFGYLAAASQAPGGKSKGKGEKQATATAVGDDVGGEWAGVMEAEYFDFVLFEVPEVPI